MRAPFLTALKIIVLSSAFFFSYLHVVRLKGGIERGEGAFQNHALLCPLALGRVGGNLDFVSFSRPDQA